MESIMRHIKNLMINLSLILISIGLVLIYWYNYDGRLGEGDYFLYYAGFDAIKKKGEENLHIADTLIVDYNDNFIIAQRLSVRFFYDCKKPILSDSNIKSISIFGNRVEYVIIDKKKDLIYITLDDNKFIRKKDELGIQLNFTDEDNDKVKNKLIKNKYLYHNDVTLDFALKNCKEDFIYSIIEY